MTEENTIKYVTCADIGGSHITVAVIDLDDHSMVDGTLIRLEVNSKATWANILATWMEALTKSNSVLGSHVSHLGLAMPGPFDYKNGVSFIRGLSKYEAIYGLNIKQLLAEELNVNPENIKFRNDAEATIAGEVLAGAGMNYHNVIGVTLGTGFGSAQFIEQQCSDLNLGSEPFKETIADDYLSTRWFLKSYFEKTGLSLTGGVKELAEIAADNSTARELFKEFGDNMGTFLKAPLQLNDPEALILCGNIAKASSYFLPNLKKHLSTNIKLAVLGELAPLIGAAVLFQTNPINQPIT